MAPTAALNDETLRQAKQNFQAMDKNGDGQLSFDEFREGLGRSA